MPPAALLCRANAGRRKHSDFPVLCKRDRELSGASPAKVQGRLRAPRLVLRGCAVLHAANVRPARHIAGPVARPAEAASGGASRPALQAVGSTPVPDAARAIRPGGSARMCVSCWSSVPPLERIDRRC